MFDRFKKSQVSVILLVVLGGVTALLSGGFYLENTALFNQDLVTAFKTLLFNYWYLFTPLAYVLFYVLANIYGEGYQEIDLTQQ